MNRETIVMIVVIGAIMIAAVWLIGSLIGWPLTFALWLIGMILAMAFIHGGARKQ